jgi:hypothetical protein
LVVDRRKKQGAESARMQWTLPDFTARAVMAELWLNSVKIYVLQKIIIVLQILMQHNERLTT